MSIFGDIADQLDVPEPALERMAEFVLGEIQEGFEQEQDPEGRQWESLDPDYAATKRGPGILREDQVLEGSMTFELREGAVVIGPDDSVQPGEKIGAHQRGATGGGGSIIKERPHTGISDANAEQIPIIMLGHLTGEQNAPRAEFPL